MSAPKTWIFSISIFASATHTWTTYTVRAATEQQAVQQAGELAGLSTFAWSAIRHPNHRAAA